MYYGRRTRKPNSKTTQEELKRPRKAACALLALSLLLLYLGSALAACVQALGGWESLDAALRAFPRWIAKTPWPFHAGMDDFNVSCLSLGLVAATAPWVLFALHLQKRGNYDPGREHGDARWATRREMERLVDKELPSNNFMHTQHSGLVNRARNDMIAAWVSAKNKNACYVGASGAGKTARVVKPRVMASLGTMLWPGCKNELGLRDEGFDILVTDPKGDLIYDVGHALVNAGRAVKPFNTIFPSKSLHYNPLHYIKTRMVDAVKPEETRWRLSASIDGEPAALAMRRCRPLNFVERRGTRALDWKGQPDMDRYSMRHEPEPSAWVCPECQTINDGISLVCEDPDCSCKSPSAYPDDVRISVRPVLKQKVERADARELEEVSDERLGIASAPGMPSVRDVCAGMEYTSSTITYAVEVRACGPSTRTVAIELALDPHLRVVALPSPTATLLVEQAERYDVEGRRVVRFSCTLKKGARGADVGMCVQVVTRVELMEVPDGVDLTRTANCLVNNLAQKSDKASEDPFWDNAFRLLLMGLVAYLFEVYDEKYRSLRWVMYLLNRARVDSAGAAISPLDQMFDTWETGTVYTEAQAPDDPFAVAEEGRFSLCDAQDLEPLELDDDGTPISLAGWAGPHDPDNDMALGCYKAFAQGAPETKQSILITAQVAFSKLLNEDMRALLDYDEMSLETIGDAGQAQAIFLIGSDTDPSFAFLHALMMYQIINLTCDKALEKYGGSLPRHFHIIADEFANTGRLPDIDRTIAVVRSRNISIDLFLQSVQQLARVYGEEAADVIRDNCSTYVFLGGQSEKTLEGLEKMAGTETVDMWQLTRSFGAQGSTSENRQAVQRNLVTMAELRQLPDDEAIVQMTGMPMIKDKKIGFGAYDFYEWIDPTREKRGASKGARKFAEPFDVSRYLADVRAGGEPYDLRPDLIDKPAAWAA